MKHKRKLKILQVKKVISAIIAIMCIAIFLCTVVNISKTGNTEPKTVAENEFTKNLPAVVKPSLYGYDRNSNPFTIQADKILDLKSEVKDIININAEFLSKQNNKIYLSALLGSLNESQSYIDLHGKVYLKNTNFSSLTSDNMRFFYNTNIANGQGNVKLVDNMATVEADAFKAEDEYNVIIFQSKDNNKVKAVVNQ